ncbi:YceD family protein [Ornithinimicrobium sediminis]|uniref:YceD family protein n=1 Tax=Ornithinimicrobium sediminis TaxID=2904603 RepID=UPI001E2D6603|nr:YceD family protein [Ornithinimicrobium sediminis]MCE0486611.1 YceD family protein [Ornithinimicrobium sediminis]
MAHQDIEGPWVFDTRELVRRPGTMRALTRVVEAPEVIGTDVIAIPPGRPVEVELRMESVVEGVLATGSVRSSASGVCVRCLEDLDVRVDVGFQELFAYPDRAAHHQQVAADEEQDEQHTLDHDLMDLEEVLRDAVVTALPFQPVCRDDCPGLCSECGARLADDPDHHHDVIDPRWSALADLAAAPTDDEKRT